MPEYTPVVLLSVSPETVQKPYCFYMTQKKVYSLEELLYHCYFFWKQSIDDFLMGNLEQWIEEQLHLSHIASKITWIKNKEKTITDQYMGFLDIIEYFTADELHSIQKEMFRWEHKDEWEKCREKGDYLLQQHKLKEALQWYEKGLQLEEDALLLNNTGVAYMKLGEYDIAYQYLQRALDKKMDDPRLLLNLIEVSLCKKKTKKAQEYLKLAQKTASAKDLYFYEGELHQASGNYKKAEESYKKAVELGDQYISIVKLAGLYTKQNQYEEAVKTLQQISLKNPQYYIELAQIFYEWGRNEQAIKYAKEALEQDQTFIPGWLFLARLFREKKDLPSALEAVEKARSLSPEMDGVQLEYARIQKAQGKAKDYQYTLKSILKKWIERYRQGSL